VVEGAGVVAAAVATDEPVRVSDDWSAAVPLAVGLALGAAGAGAAAGLVGVTDETSGGGALSWTVTVTSSDGGVTTGGEGKASPLSTGCVAFVGVASTVADRIDRVAAWWVV
jgi:hypothetical protein